jgi:hypothetical protein
MFKNMFETAQSDPGEFRAIVEVLLHRLKWSSAGKPPTGPQGGSELGSESGAEAAPQIALSDRLSGGSKVWVRGAMKEQRGPSSAADSVCPVEVQCPHISLVRWHSAQLADEIIELTKYWEGIPDIKSKLSKAGSIPPEFKALEGDFEIWQEVICSSIEKQL